MSHFELANDGSPVFVIETEPDRQCKTCGQYAECRPYGPNGTDLCTNCAMKDWDGMVNQFHKMLDSVD